MSEKKISLSYENAWKSFIEIEKYEYNENYLKNYLTNKNLNSINVIKLNIKTKSGQTIKSTYYQSKEITDNLVIYLHTRGGSQLEGLFILNDILPKINYLIFDFAGSGKSTGKYISLGPKEADDLNDIIEYIRKKFNLNKIILWGRSMGSISIIWYINKYYSKNNNYNFLKGIILDSPFTDFNLMVTDLIKSINNKIPSCLVTILLYFIRKTIKNKINIDLSIIKTINLVEYIDIPAIYLVAKNDKIARPDRVKELYNKHKCVEKEFYLLEGEHQTVRDKNSILRCILFIFEKLIS